MRTAGETPRDGAAGRERRAAGEGTPRVPPAEGVHRGIGRAELFDLAENDPAAIGSLAARLAAEGRGYLSSVLEAAM